ncbi:MAG: OmpA family protein [Thiobacillus sp.]
MRTPPFVMSIIGATLLSSGMLAAHAAEGRFYDPTNAASSAGRTVGHELFKTIGCPGKGLLEAPCKEEKPADSDGDGVVDSKDKCPTTPPNRKVNVEGCELDSDGDGVVDSLDKCPTTPAGRKVNAEGCELDSDGDGVIDSLDKCPTVFAQTADGCPAHAAKKAPVGGVIEGVQFNNDQSTLRLEAFAILDRAAATIKEWGDVKVEVAGHTDSSSDDDYNLKLSQRRAEVVRSYLIGKGIQAEQLSARGYGESRPIADNGTAEGRFKNRRVELVPLK